MVFIVDKNLTNKSGTKTICCQTMALKFVNIYLCSWAQFCCKMWGTAWWETNILIGSMQKWRFTYTYSQSYF